MIKYIIGIIIVIVLVALGITLFKGGGLIPKKVTTTIGAEKFSLEVADTDKKREVGLSSKKSLGKNEGMLFVFPVEDYPTFWMKGMSFPIDIIFINKGKIVTLYKNVPSPVSKEQTPTSTYAPSSPSDRVIEIKAGRADELKIKVGDTITLPL